MTDIVSVLIADDEPLVRQGLRGILESDPALVVAGEAGDGAEAITMTRQLRPDVVCMDIRMPGIVGIRATERLLALPARPRVLVVTTFGSDDHVLAALAAGASGFVLKRASAQSIITAVHTVASGESLVFPEAVRALAVDQIRRLATYTGLPLTERETEVLRLIATGMTNAEIAAYLVVSVETSAHMFRGCSRRWARATAPRPSSSPTRSGSCLSALLLSGQGHA